MLRWQRCDKHHVPPTSYYSNILTLELQINTLTNFLREKYQA